MQYTKTKKWTKIGLWSLIFITLSSGYFTYLGLSEDSDFLTAVLRTFVSMLASFILWKFLFENLATATNPKARKFMFLGSIIALFVLLSLSSYYNICGIASPRARLHHLEILLTSASEKFDEILIVRKQEIGIKPHLETSATAFMLHAKGEAKHGTVSRKWRRGPVASSLRTLSKGFTDQVKRIDDHSEKIGRLKYKGHRLLTDVRDIIDDNEIDITDKNSSVQKKLNTLNDVLFEMNNSTVIGQIGVLIDQIDGLFFINNDEQVLEAVRGPIAKAKSLIQEQIAELEGRRITLERYRVLSGIEAIQKYFVFVWPEVATSVTIDLLFPAMILMILFYVSRYSGTQSHPMKGEGDEQSQTAGTQESSISDMLERLDHNRKRFGGQNTG